MKKKYIVTPEIIKLGIKSSVVAEIYNTAIEYENFQLNQIKSKTLKKVLMLTESDLTGNLILESYRNLVKSIGRSVKKFPPSAESLIKLIHRSGQFPKINTAVDAYNIVVTIKYLALGVHDFDKLGDKIVFRFSEKQEPFTPVGGDHVKFTQPGDFLYSDENHVLAWLDSKDSELVKLTKETKNIVIIIQGTPYTKKEYNLTAIEDACKIITKFCGGTYEIQSLF